MSVFLSPFEHLKRIRKGSYMESGYLDLKSVFLCDENAFFPATLHFDPATSAYNASIPKPMQQEVYSDPLDLTGDSPFFGETPAEGQESLAVGCNTKYEVTEDACGNEYSNGGYCPGYIVRKKQAQNVVPSSMFSGKLRLLVQALYGSDYDAVSYRFGDNFTLNIGYGEASSVADYRDVTLFRGYDGGGFLYTTADLNYFYCKYTPGALMMSPLDLSAEGQAFKDDLIASGRASEYAFVKRVEALILSTAKINSGNALFLDITGDVVLGTPLDYGWHSTWSGQYSTIVCSYDANDIVEPHYISNQYQLEIFETFDEGLQAYVYSANVTTLIANQKWWPFTNGLQVYYYDFLENSMYPVRYPNLTPGGQTGVFDAPIYCYYKHDDSTGADTLVTCSIYMDISAGASSSSNSVQLGDKIYDLADLVRHFNRSSTSGGDKGFRVTPSAGGNSGVEITVQTGGSNFEQKYTGITGFFNTDVVAPFNSDAFADAEAYANSVGYSIGDTKDGFWEGNPTALHLKWQGFKVSPALFIQLTESEITRSGSAFLQVSLGSCDEVVIGEETSETQGAGNTSTSGNVSGFWYYGGRLVWTTSSTSLLQIAEVETEFVPAPYYSYVDLPGFSPVTEEWDAIGPLYFNEVSRHSEVYSSLASGNSLGDDRYFHPGIITPATGTVDYSRKAISGDFKLTHTLALHTEGFLHHSAVGWV